MGRNSSGQPLLSIFCQTYNHESYIRQCLEGFVVQKTTFKFEILVHEDASTDNTAKILKEYEVKNPDLFRCVYQTENQFTKQNALVNILFPMARGKYIALCEGDDYWTDPYKLQKQVDFLEENPEYGLIYSKVKVFSQKDDRLLEKPYGDRFSTIEDLFLFNYIPTPTAMFKANLFSSYVAEINPCEKKWLMGDYPLWMYIASVSKVKFMEDCISVYRKLENSATHSSDFKKELTFLDSYKAIKLFFMHKLGYGNLEKKINEHYFSAKAHIYLFKNEQNISELIDELDKTSIRTFKIYALRFIISHWPLRRFLKSYWQQ